MARAEIVQAEGENQPGMLGHRKLVLLQLSFPRQCWESFKLAEEQLTTIMNGWSNEWRWHYEERQRSDAAKVTVSTDRLVMNEMGKLR